MGVDVGGGSGADDSAIAIRRGNKLLYCQKFNLEILELIDKISELFSEYNVDRIQIECDGIGKDKFILLEKSGLPVVGIQSGGGAGSNDDFIFDKKENDDIKKRFNRKRDELWYNMRGYLNPLRIQVEGKLPILIPKDDDLIKEFLAFQYDDTNKIKVSSKDDLRKILKGSPNKADSVLFAFAESTTNSFSQYSFGGFSIGNSIDRTTY